MRHPTPSPKFPHRAATTLALGMTLWLGVASGAQASDDPPPSPHDACGPDGGPHIGGDASIGDYVFSEPIAAPAGARWEPACSASPSSAGSSVFASLSAIAALATRRRSR